MKKVEETQRTVESAVFTISKVVRAYFDTVMHVQDFIMALDSTGVYFFTNESNTDAILVKLSNYIEQLALEKGEFLACVVSYDTEEITEDKFFELLPSREEEDTLIYEINPNSFETSLRLIMRDRGICFTDDELKSIKDCFYARSFAKYTMGYYLAENGFDLDPDKVEAMEDHPLITLEYVVNEFGRDDAEEIYRAICSFRSLHAEEYKRLMPKDLEYKRTSWESATKASTVLGSIAFALAVVMCLIHVPVLGIIFAFIGLLQGRHLHLVYKSTAATVLTWLNMAMLLASLVMAAFGYKHEIIAFLHRTLLISR